MSISTLINTPCTIIQRTTSGSKDRYGNDVATETTFATVCEIQQVRRDEQDDQGETSDTEWRGFFLPGEDIRTGDAVIADGPGEFELVGDPWPARNPRTQLTSHLEAELRKTSGAEDAS